MISPDADMKIGGFIKKTTHDSAQNQATEPTGRPAHYGGAASDSGGGGAIGLPGMLGGVCGWGVGSMIGVGVANMFAAANICGC